jgi:hypothetical protein
MRIVKTQLRISSILGIYYNEGQLHVSATDVGHLQVVHETYRVAIYRTWGVYRVWERGLCGREISYMSTVGA